MEKKFMCLQTQTLNLNLTIPTDLVHLAKGLYLTARGTGRIFWILMAHQPVNQYLRFTVNALRIGSTLQAVLLLALVKLERPTGGVRTIQRRVAWIPLYGLAVCLKKAVTCAVQVILQPCRRKLSIEEIRCQEVETKTQIYKNAKDGKTVLPFAHSETIHIFNQRRLPHEPPFYGLSTMHVGVPSVATPLYKVVEGLSIGVPAETGSKCEEISLSTFSMKNRTAKAAAADLVRLAEKVTAAWRDDKAVVLHSAQEEAHSLMLASFSLYLMYSSKGLQIDEALSIAIQSHPGSELTQEQLWIISRLADYQQNPEQLDDSLLPLAIGDTLPFGAANIPLPDGSTILTQAFDAYSVATNETQRGHLAYLNRLSSPEIGGSLLLTDWSRISPEKKQALVEYLSLCEPELDAPCPHTDGLWAALRLRRAALAVDGTVQNDLHYLEQITGCKATRTAIREARESIISSTYAVHALSTDPRSIMDRQQAIQDHLNSVQAMQHTAMNSLNLLKKNLSNMNWLDSLIQLMKQEADWFIKEVTRVQTVLQEQQQINNHPETVYTQ